MDDVDYILSFMTALLIMMVKIRLFKSKTNTFVGVSAAADFHQLWLRWCWWRWCRQIQAASTLLRSYDPGKVKDKPNFTFFGYFLVLLLVEQYIFKFVFRKSLTLCLEFPSSVHLKGDTPWRLFLNSIHYYLFWFVYLIFYGLSGWISIQDAYFQPIAQCSVQCAKAVLGMPLDLK